MSGTRKRVIRVETGRVFTGEEVAARWATSVEMFYSMCRDGRLPGAFKVGRVWRITEEALLRYERTGGFGSVPWGESA